MLSPEMLAALNAQIQAEFYSANLYLAMSAWCEEANLPGFARWLRTQYEEERGHGLKLFDHVLDRGGRAVVPAIAAPEATFGSIVEVFRQVHAHEQKVTAGIHALQALAVKESDWATQVELAWFIKEQVEEEKNAAQWLAHLEMVGEKSAAILNLDHQAGKRGK